MKLRNFGRVFLPKAVSTVMFFLLCGLTALVVTGCDEGMNMAGPVIMGPGEEPAETPGEDQKPSSNGEMKQRDDEKQLSDESSGDNKDPGSEQPEPTPKPTPAPHENDFVGQVEQMLLADEDHETSTYTSPVAGVTLTIASGERAGEQIVTDEDGNYRFSDPTGETLQLRLRAEKEGYEPKKVIVHRSQSTETLAGGVHFSHWWEKPQETPGTILIGHRWPDKARFILEETVLPHDLLLLIVDDVPNYAGFYSKRGVVVAENTNCLLKIIAHELGHAHQHAVAVIERGPTASVGSWETTPSDKAYLKAREKDWEEVGKVSFETGRFLTFSIESMAETAENFWNIRGRFDTPRCFNTLNMAKEMPNRLRWAQEWLSKKYE